MTPHDRNVFFEALSTVYNVRMERGILQYGYKYRDSHYMTRKHLQGAARKDCDHWHDSSGIMTKHMAFTLEMEQALQSIDPSIAIPYWDYTIDSYLYGSECLKKSPVFDPDWFGSADTNESSHIVTEGRWAYTNIMQNARGYSNITNPWGMLRSPWNTNPTQYLSRSTKIFDSHDFTDFPDCAMFHFAFLSTSLSELQNFLNGGTHGPVHIMIGGHWGNKEAATFEKFLSPRMSDVLLLSKWLWRSGYIRCPMNCAPEQKCRCECPVEVLGNSSAYEILRKSHALHWLTDDVNTMFYLDERTGEWHIAGKSLQEEDEIWASLLAGLCDVGWPGEMFTSAAPYDPMFWVVHPTNERLLSWLRILGNQNKIPFDESFSYNHHLSTASNMTPPSDTGFVCDWTGIDELSLQMPVCTKKQCPGHGANDTIPFRDFLDRDETYTNQEFYDFMYPFNPELPYMYDNFLWEHCEAQGYNFTAPTSNKSNSAYRR